MSTPVADQILPLLKQAQQQISQGQLQQAAQSLNMANGLQPGDARVHMLASLMAEKSGNLKAALESMQRAVNMAPDWGPGLLELALLHARHNQFKLAVAPAEKIFQLEPNNPIVLGKVLEVAERCGHHELAVRVLRHALALSPQNADAARLALATHLQALSRHAEALEVWNALLAQQPDQAQALLGRLQTHLAMDNVAAAQADADRLLAIAPDAPNHQYYARLAQGQIPNQLPAALTQALFDGMADVYDHHMINSLGYRLPQQVAEQILARHPDRQVHVLDLGCGTGLLGACLGRLKGALVGVDLSHKMVEKAARHGVYDKFHTVDVHDALRDTPESLYPVITALDVFIYAGVLDRAIPDAHRILTPGGQLIFSCETAPEDGPDLWLQTNGRYAHKRSQVEALCKSSGFDRVDVQDQVLRHEAGLPVQGFVVTAHKAEAATSKLGMQA